jgi:hypothetical protein
MQRLVPERVGQPLHGKPRGDSEAFEMQRAMYLDELHRARRPYEHRERRVPQVLTLRREGVRNSRRDRRRALHASVPKPVDDVLRFDPRPHDDSYLCEPATHLRHLRGKGLLRGVDHVGLTQQFVACGVVLGPFLGPTRQTPIATRKRGLRPRCPRLLDRLLRRRTRHDFLPRVAADERGKRRCGESTEGV